MDDKAFNAAKEYVLTLQALEAIFDFWNEKMFDGALEKPVITAGQDRRGRAYGWFVPSRIWKKDAAEKGSPEINMCSQYLSRTFEEIAQTMLHEMCHLYAFLHEVADTSSNGRYHNRAFKTIAESHGMLVEKSNSYGYSITKLSEKSRELLAAFEGERRFLYDVRPRASKDDFQSDAERQNKKTRPPVARFTFRCPKCGQRIKGYENSANLLCSTCMVPFEKETR